MYVYFMHTHIHAVYRSLSHNVSVSLSLSLFLSLSLTHTHTHTHTHTLTVKVKHPSSSGSTSPTRFICGGRERSSGKREAATICWGEVEDWGIEERPCFFLFLAIPPPTKSTVNVNVCDIVCNCTRTL